MALKTSRQHVKKCQMSLLMVTDKIWEDRNVSKRELFSFKENLKEIFLPKDLAWLKTKAISPFNFSSWQNILEVRNCLSAPMTQGVGPTAQKVE